MPKVTFVPDKLTVEVAAGTPVPDIVDDSGASLPFGCRHGSCGTCRLVVVSGAEHVNPMTDAENELFATLTAVEKNERLGCQLIIAGDVALDY